MKDWIKNLFADANGDSDEMAVITIISVLGYVSVMIYNAIIEHHFDAQATGIGLGALIGGAATGMGFKAKQETNREK